MTPARVEAVVDGQVFSEQVNEAKGGPDAPMSDDDLHRKVQDCLSFGGFDPARAADFKAAVTALETSTDISADLGRLIRRVIS